MNTGLDVGRDERLQTTIDAVAADRAENKSSGGKTSIIGVVVLSAIACIAAFIFEGHKGLNLMDEGFLWYGSQRVLHGEIPLRDFMSYDIARYYWAAAWMALVGNHGVVALRAATAVFGGIGVALGAWMVSRAGGRTRWLIVAAAIVVFLLWMVPRHKLYDITASIMTVVAVANLLRNKDTRGFFISGVVAGVAAMIGRNHGVYSVAATMLAMPLLFVARQKVGWLKALPSFAIGVAVGYLPMLGLTVFMPGFFGAVRDSVTFTMAAATAIGYPVPWPWDVIHWATFDVQQFAVGCFYVALVAFDVVGGLAVLLDAVRNRRITDPAFAATVIVSIFYSHHAFYYAGINHLAQAAFPMLIGILIAVCKVEERRLPAGIKSGAKPSGLPPAATIAFQTAALAVLLAGSFITTSSLHPALIAHGKHWAKCSVDGDSLSLDPSTAAEVTGIQDLVRRYAPRGRFVMLPYWPTIYAMYEQRAPFFDIYSFFQRSADFQRNEITQLKNFDADVVLLLDHPPDGQNAWLFERTNPLMNRYLQESWQKLPCSLDQPYLTVYGKKQ